jgi:hypothetical protein
MRKPWLVVAALAASLIVVTLGYGAIMPYPMCGRHPAGKENL